MKKSIGAALVLWGALSVSPAIGLADDGLSQLQVRHHWRRWQPLPKGEQVLSTPELDPGVAGQALALLLGAAALMFDRSRRQALSL